MGTSMNFSFLSNSAFWLRIVILLCLGLLYSAPARSESGTDDSLLDIPLVELMNFSVNTSGNFTSSWRNQPGIITVFTSSDIQAMGARTLRDVLLRVPGVSLGMDNHNAVGLMLRGNWTLEGKIQYLVNDIPVNDVIFGTFPIPPYLPADQLDRVEILRGPGSVKYGDSAQLAVIRIYTLNQANDAHVSFTGMDQSGTSTGIVNINNRIDFENGSLALAASFNKGHWGSGNWLDNQGTSVDVSAIGTDGSNLAADLDLQGTNVQFYYNHYRMDAVQNFGTYSPSTTVSFRQATAAVSRLFFLSENWSIRPRMSYRTEATWQDLTARYDIRGARMVASLDATNRYSMDGSVSFGYYYQQQMARPALPPTSPTPFYPGSGWVKYPGSALYGNWNFMIGDFNLSMGARASDHQYSGSSVTPQFGLTRSTEKWHFKWLYGTATRDPNLEQINPSNHPQQAILRTERTTVNELEFGRALNERSYLTLSLFDQKISDPIIYLPNPGGFTNNAPVIVRGVELQYWYRGDRSSVQANYCLTRSNNSDAPPLYNAQDQNGQFLGAASQIANLWSEWHTLTPGLSVLLGARYLGSRTAFVYVPALGTVTQQKLKAEQTLNAGLRYKLKQMILSGGVHNITNEEQFIPQPYDASVPGNPGSTPFPVDGRELWIRIEWPL